MLACPLACHEREFDSDMTTQPNAQPASQPASKPASAAAPSLNWQYPFPRNNQKSIANPQDLYSILGLMDDGFFPLGVNGFPHGGIHFGAAVSKDLDLSGGVRCIADGEIVAYKVDGGYPQLRFTQSGTWSMYSTGFVLVRHRLMMPPAPNSTGPQPADDCHDVYSLYMHLADWSTYLGDGKLDRPSWWLGVDAYRVGNKARQDAAKKGGSLGASGSFVWTEPKPGKKANQFTRGQHVGFLPEGSELTIGEKRGKPGKQWGHIAAITAGGMISPTDGGIFGEEDNPVPWKHDDDATPNAPVMPEGDWGWVYMPELQPVREPKPTGSVVIPPAPIQVRAGTLMGQLGEYHDYERSTPLPPVAKRQLLHMEVFADDGFTAFLAKCRERAAQLPKEQRTTLVLNKGAKLVSQLTPPDVTLRPAREWAPTQNCPTTGRWAYTYTAIRQPVSKVRTEVDGPMWMERADTKQPPVVGGKGWRNFPLQLAAADAQVGFSCAYPRARLEALPADCQAVDTEGNRWWKVEFGSETGHTASGWVREQGHPGTQWQSPWAWPDFEIVDATGINLADAFRRNIVISGTADYKEQKEFEPSLVAVNNNPLLFKLGQIVSKLPDRSGYTGKLDKKGGKPTVTAAKMQEAMRTAWLSDELAHIILRYESEWGGNMSRWDAITPLMRNARENWQCEVQRIKKLQWWDDVKKVAGFPASPTVLHIHPVALVGNFQNHGCINVEEFLRIYEAEHVSFEAGTRPLDDESKNHLRVLLMGIIAAYERYKKGGCNIPYIAYMLATARHETAKYYSNMRKTIYFQPVTESGAFSYFNRYDPVLADTLLRRQTAVRNGNTVEGDGYTFRGRGYVQLTWKDNYRKVGDQYGIDLVSNPDRALEPEIAAFVTVYGMENGIFTGRKLSDYLNEDNEDYFNARRIINGTDQAERISGYALKFKSILERSRQ